MTDTNLPFPDLPASHPANKLDPRMLRVNDSKFSAKLRFHERCSIAALQLAGLNPRQVALAYGIHVRTAVRMLDRKKYADVRAERERIGEKDFIATYVTEDAVAKVTAMANHPDLVPETQPPKGSTNGIPNHRASSNGGISVYKPAEAPHSHRIEVKWHKPHDDAPEGWWSLLLDDPEMEGVWFGDVDKNTHVTSSSALNYAKAYLDARYG